MEISVQHHLGTDAELGVGFDIPQTFYGSVFGDKALEVQFQGVKDPVIRHGTADDVIVCPVLSGPAGGNEIEPRSAERGKLHDPALLKGGVIQGVAGEDRMVVVPLEAGGPGLGLLGQLREIKASSEVNVGAGVGQGGGGDLDIRTVEQDHSSTPINAASAKMSSTM